MSSECDTESIGTIIGEGGSSLGKKWWKRIDSESRLLRFVGASLVLILLPLLLSSYNLYTVNLVLLTALGAIALNILTGNCGQVSLGNAAFLGIGAFTVATLGSQLKLGIEVTLPAAVIFTCLLGFIVGLPSLRLGGMYLLLATLAIHYIFLFVGQQYQTARVGPGGFQIGALSIFGWQPSSQTQWYIVLAVVYGLCALGVTNLLRTKPGRAWGAISTSEPVASALGISVTRYKMLAFIVSSGIIGLQGALFAYFTGNVSIDAWDLNTAISYVAMIVLGGLGSVFGSTIGALVVTLLPIWIGNFLTTTSGLPTNIASNAGPITTFVYGALICGVLLVAPTGIAGLLARAWGATFQKLLPLQD